MSEELQIIEADDQQSASRSAYIAPVISLEQAIINHGMLKKYVSKLLVEGHDFGAVPGTSGKVVLLKPGAEKLTTIFGLTKRFALVASTQDWEGSQHNGEPFFYYLYRCGLWKGDLLIAESDGSCNSFESKYRYRKAERICPDCGQAAIIKGKPEYGGGWLCYKNKGGCGLKFHENDASITKQQVGRVVNPEIADLVNTIQKMAQKRALVGTTLLAVNASEFFTQDIEDFEHTGTDFPPQPTRATAGKASASSPREAAPPAEDYPNADDLPNTTPRQTAVALLKKHMEDCGINQTTSKNMAQPFFFSLVGCESKDSTTEQIEAANEALAKALNWPLFMNWCKQEWTGSLSRKAEVLGLIVAVYAQEGAEQVKACCGIAPDTLKPAQQLKLIENLASFLAPDTKGDEDKIENEA